MISIIIVNYNGKEQTRNCLQSLRTVSSAAEHEIIIVDNCSSDGSTEMVQAEFPEVILLSQASNIGFGRANNIGAEKARGEYLFFVNNDTVFQTDLLVPLKAFIDKHPSAGVVAPMLLNSDGSYQLSNGKFPSIINEIRTKKDTAFIKNIPEDKSPKQVDWVSFAAVMFRRSAFENIHGFDERYFMYFEDADVCYRLSENGYSTYYYPEYFIVHVRGGSWTQETTERVRYEYRRSQILFYHMHRNIIVRAMLRMYLITKYILHLFASDNKNENTDYKIIKMLLKPTRINERPV